MADAGEMWIELGLRDNVNEKVEQLLSGFRDLDNQVADVVRQLHAMHDYANKDEKGWTKDAIAQAKEYYNLVTKVSQAERELNAVLKERSTRKMNSDKELEAWEKLMKLRDQLKNGVHLENKDFVNAFKLSLENTVKEVKDQVATAKGEMKKFDEVETKKAEVRRAITAETERLAAAEERIQRMRDDASSKATIASIKDQTVEYDAQMQKVRELDALLKKVEKDRLAALRGSGMPHSTMTESAINKEVDAIQRRYNEDVATGNKLAQDAANAKKQQEEAQNKLNATLRESERLENAVAKARMDAESQARISRIQQKTADYNAAIIKARELEDLERKIAADRAVVSSGGTATYTKERVLAELDAIQRRYNEALYVGREYERQDAEAKKQAADASRRLAEANKSLMTSYDKVTQSGKQTMSTLSMLRQQAGYYFSLFGAQTLLRNVITIGGQFEFQHVALQNIIGDAEKATAIFAQLKDLAVESPKTFMELTASAKQLSAYQIPANELFDTTKRLSDLSVGLGVDINRLILAYGQVRSAAVLRGQELRQFTEAGIPMVQALAQKFTELNGKVTTTADVFKLISQRAVSFEMVKEVLWDMTNQGGQFFNMQETMADTLYGKWQKLQDIWQITLGEMADTNFGGFKPFHALIDTLVFAARNLTNLMPILTGLMTAKGFSFIKSSALNQFSSTGLDRNIAQAQKLQAIELRRSYVNGEITKKIYQQRMALNANKDNYYMLLAAEGRISNYQIRRLIEEKKITAEKIRQGLANGTLIQQEAVQLRLLMQQNAQGKLGTVSSMAKGIGSGLLSFVGGWWGVALAGLGAAWSIYSNYKQKAEEEEAQAKERIKSAQELWKNADITLRAAVNEGASESAVTNMSQWLKENAASWDMVSASMKNNDGTAKTLEERYEILKKAIEGVKNASEQAANGTNPFAGKEGVGVAEDLQDAQESLDEFQKVLNDKVALNYSRFRKAMDEVIAASPNFKKALEMEGATNSLTRQMEILQRFPQAFKQFRGIFSTEMTMLVPINEIRDAWGDFQDELQNAHDNLPNLAAKIESDMRNKWDDINFKNLTNEQREYLMKLYKDWLEKNNITSTAVLQDLDNKFLNKRYNIRLVFTAEQGNDLNSFQKDALGYLGKGATPFKKGAVQRWGQGGSAYAARNMAKSEIDAAYNEWQSQDKMIKSLKKQGKKVSDEAESLNRSLEANYNDLVSAAWSSLGYQYDGNGLKSNKTPKTRGGGTKTDALAKAMNERVSVLKDAYSEYKKWSELVGKEGALAKVKESGLFGSLFADKDFKGLGDYKGELQRIKSKLSPEKSEQRKVIESIDKVLLGMDYDDAKEEAEKAVELLRSSMEKMSRRWDTYKSIYEKTGNKENAMQLVFGNTEYLRRGVESAQDYWKSMLASVSEGMTASELDGMTDKELSERFGETWKTVKAYRDEYMKAFRASADEEEKIYLELLEESMTFADKMAKIEAQRIREVNAAGGDKNLIYAANQRAKESVSELDFQNLKERINWDVVFGNLDTYTKDVLVKVRKQLKDYLRLNRTNMSVKDIKEMGTAINNINNAIQKEAGLFGGLKDAQHELTDATKDLLSAQVDYNAAIELYGEESKQVEDAMKRVNEAQNRVVTAQGGVKKAQNDTIGSITAISSALTSLGKSSEISLSEVGSAIGSIVSALSSSGSTYGQLIAAIFSLLDAIGEKGIGNFVSNIFGSVGNALIGLNEWNPFNHIFSKHTVMGKFFGAELLRPADYRDYDNALVQYNNLISVWETLAETKQKYFDQNWGSEARKAANEAREIIEAQIEATRIIAKERLGAGASAGSHSIGYRMWEGSYKFQGKNWVNVAREAKRGMKNAGLGDVVFNSMEDMTRMTADQLEYLMKNYTGLWAHMDDDFKGYLEKLIEYYRRADEQTEKLKEKLTGWNFQSLSDSWANTIANMSNSSTNLFEDFEDGLREAIINAMVSNIYSSEMKNLVNGLADAAQNELYTDVAGNVKKHTYDTEGNILDTDVLSEYTQEEYNNMRAVAENLAEREAASRDLLADLYGWQDKDGTSSASQVLSGLSEADQGLFMSYVNAIRGDVSVLRTIAEQESGTLTGMNATVQLQLRELEAISANTRRNADSAEFIETFCRGLRDGEYTLKVK